MPNSGTDTDLELEPEDEEIDESTDDTADGDDSAAGDSKAKGAEDKRIRDLQARADKETARANKAEALLASRGESGADGSNDPERAALVTELREASLDAVYGEFAELKEYGIDRALIEGATRAQMRESATSLVGLVKGVETKVRNKVLREHGIKAEPAGSARSAPKDYGSMSDEDFEKELARARSGGAPIW